MAGEGRELRIVSYNIRAGIGPGDFPRAWWRQVDVGRLGLIAETIRGLDPDIVSLQEVALGSIDGTAVDQAALLGGLTGLDHRYGALAHFALRDPETGETSGAALWGNAILSRLPILASRTHALPRAGDDDLVEPAGADLQYAGRRYREAPSGAREWRCVLHCQIEAGGQRLQVLSAHLTHVGSNQRLRQAAWMARFGRLLDGPVMLAGDLNASIESPDLDPLRGGFLDAFAESGTPPGDPRRGSILHLAIDHVLVRGFEVESCRVVREAGDLSDHWPVVADLRLSGGSGSS